MNSLPRHRKCPNFCPDRELVNPNQNEFSAAAQKVPKFLPRHIIISRGPLYEPRLKVLPQHGQVEDHLSRLVTGPRLKDRPLVPPPLSRLDNRDKRPSRPRTIGPVATSASLLLYEFSIYLYWGFLLFSFCLRLCTSYRCRRPCVNSYGLLSAYF